MKNKRMTINRPRNTKERGVMEFLTYKEGNTFIGVCLSFDIVEEGNDPVVLMRSIKEAALLHLQTVQKENLSDDLLNRYAPEEYWKKYFETARQIEKPSSITTNTLITSPYYRAMNIQMA